MAVAFVDKSTTPAGGAGASSVSPTLPAVSDNDIGLLVVAVTDLGSVVTLPAGWAQAFSVVGPTMQFILGWKRLAAADGGVNQVVTRTGQTGAIMAAIMVYMGVRPSGDPWDVAPVAAFNASGTAVAADAIATQSPDNAVVMAAVHGIDLATPQFSGWTSAGTGAMTERLDVANTVSNGVGIGIADGIQAAAGSSGAGSATLATASRSIATLIALSPNAPAEPPSAGSMEGGFVRDEATGALATTVDATGATIEGGFLRAPGGELVVTTDTTGAEMKGGFLRAPNWALVVEEAAGTYKGGYARTASRALAVTTGAGTMKAGFVRDSGGALVVTALA